MGEVLFCHATPRNDTEIFTRTTRDELLAAHLWRILDVAGRRSAGTRTCSSTSRIGHVRVVNAGQRRHALRSARRVLGCCWGAGVVQLRHTRYDLPAAAGRIRATEYPGADEFAARNVLDPPSEQQMVDAFKHAELK